jgi:L-threonylcarbamoyladenylate synthase
MAETRILPGGDAAAIREAAAALRSGQLVAFPTETVYGLGANALDAEAVARVFAAKERPAFDPLIVHLADAGEVSSYVQPADADDPRVAILAAACWPGPLTLVLRKRSSIPGIVTAGLETVGLRVPDHPVAQALLEAAGVPIAAPSANRFGRVSPTRAEHVVAQLDGRVGIVLDGGPCRVGVESTVVLLADGAAGLLRPGGMPTEAIEALIGPLSSPEDGSDSASLSPGRSARHYAPGAPLTVIGPVEGIEATAGERLGLLAADEAGRRAAETSGGPYALVEVLSTSGDPVEQASRLFDALHRLAAADVDRIVAQAVPENGLGRAIMDRLRRAATTA